MKRNKEQQEVSATGITGRKKIQTEGNDKHSRKHVKK